MCMETSCHVLCHVCCSASFNLRHGVDKNIRITEREVSFCVVVVTPMGSSSNQPQEIEDGEAGFALLFPKIDGVKIQTFHFPKDLKNRVFDESKFAEAGKSLFTLRSGLL